MSLPVLADAWVQVRLLDVARSCTALVLFIDHKQIERAIGQRPQLTGDALAMRAQYKAVNDEINANMIRSLDVMIEDKIIDGNLNVRIYRHVDATKGSHRFPVGVYFHGGGFCCGDLDSEEKMCLLLAERLPCVLVSVDYRLAPEHQAPAQLNDAMRAWTWAYNNATNLSGDRDKYFTIGQSAGGSLALSVVRQLVVLKRRHEIKGVAAIVPFAIHPSAVPARFSHRYRSYYELENSPVNTKEAMDVFYDVIGAPETDPDVYIINADTDFELFPPTYLVVCEMDPLRDDGLILRDALEAKGAVKKLSHGTYSADLTPAFCIGNVPHGGFLASVFLETAKAHLLEAAHQNVTLGHWEFLFPTTVGRAILLVEEVKKGKRMSVLHIKLYQGDIVEKAPWITSSSYTATTAYITTEKPETNDGMSTPTGWHSAPSSMPNLRLLPPAGDGNWKRLHAPPVAKALQHVEYYTFSTQDPTLATREYWIRLTDGGLFSNASLGFVCDVGPPVFIDSFRTAAEKSKARSSSTRDSWYSTLTMDMQTKKQLPERGIEWLRLRLQSKVVHNNHLDVEVLIFDELGNLIAISHHAVMIVDMEQKNTAKRRQKASL